MDPWFEVLYTVVEEGALTPRLDLLKEGDRLLVYEPSGTFSDTGTGTVWWIANGTGVAPFASFFRAGIRANRTLIHGVRTREEAYFEKEFRSAVETRAADGFGYVLCASQEDGRRPGVNRGRLTDWLREEGPTRFRVGDRFMLCGSSGMVVDAREILIGLGYRHDDIDCEIYF
jgi:ferredoxin-NADP reductase